VLRRILLALGLTAALVAAAAIKPPRAGPALRIVSSEPTGRAMHHRTAHRVPHRHRKESRPPIERVDLNRADAAAFTRIPGVSLTLAERIVAFRELNGPFESLDELTDIDGISHGRVDSLSRFLVLR